jgi:hypothetical protein
MAVWAIDCLERVLPSFEERYPEDNRPHTAIETLQAWIHTGVFKMAVIRKASLDSHPAAREVGEDILLSFRNICRTNGTTGLKESAVPPHLSPMRPRSTPPRSWRLRYHSLQSLQIFRLTLAKDTPIPGTIRLSIVSEAAVDRRTEGDGRGQRMAEQDGGISRE